MLIFLTLMSHITEVISRQAYQYKNHFTYTDVNGTVIHFSLFTEKHNIIDNMFTVVTCYMIGSVIAMLFISNVLYNHVECYIDTRMRRVSGSDTSEVDIDTDTDDIDTNEVDTNEVDTNEIDANEVIYEQQYFDLLEEMPDKELSPDELNDLVGAKVLIEDTPKGRVIMTYNATSGLFEYYSDKCSDLSYEILDTVARLFTVTYGCKQICVNYRAEVESGTNKMLTEMEYDKLIKEVREKNKSGGEDIKGAGDIKRSVFASFKTYNKKNGNNVEKKYYVVTDKANRFKFKGKMIDYERLTLKMRQKEEADSAVNKKMSYSEYKQRMLDESVGVQVQAVCAQDQTVCAQDQSVCAQAQSVCAQDQSVCAQDQSVCALGAVGACACTSTHLKQD